MIVKVGVLIDTNRSQRSVRVLMFHLNEIFVQEKMIFFHTLYQPH